MHPMFLFPSIGFQRDTTISWHENTSHIKGMKFFNAHEQVWVSANSASNGPLHGRLERVGRCNNVAVLADDRGPLDNYGVVIVVVQLGEGKLRDKDL